ncbi:MAG: ammonium transporter [Ancrocorticia sp.]|uniref:ammonium transporter n=1 Tax=Ancrocorticia sp. TaxID=2593684 RepID=UPI003F8FB5C6
MEALDTGATAWMLTSASFVLLMTPALAFFYGGMSRSKSVLNMMMMSIGTMAVIGVVYPLWGYSMSYGESSVGGIFANPFDGFNLSGLIYGEGGEFLLDDLGVPVIVGVAFQATFAIITVALISGALADRTKFSSWLVFALLWATLSYFPMAHMVWGGGLLSDSEDGLAAMLFGTTDGAATVAPIDFAGGTVVHINAGVAALVLVLIIGKRKGFGQDAFRPHNLPFVMLGAAGLWFGWFGFNAGSAFTADGAAGMAWVNTTAAASAAILGWILTEKLRFGHMTALGAASGVVAGLVAITPAAGSVSPVGAIILGAIAGAVCSLAVSLKTKFGYDDSLDVVGVHLVGGLIGTVLVGLLATDTGLFYGGGIEQTIVQIVIALVAIIYAGVITVILGFIIKVTMGWRVSAEDEDRGVDSSEHGESAYDQLVGAYSKEI